ncbi:MULTISPECIES: 50S ribosomal protein L21 [unclassified Rhodococcus (in: high G+C Gram-positive bacteria)]|uniref:50S ribosomal protein L21 n=1 Tax=unclassified Rhodococcus (in: high G+C Gram-positive bacteria) TaxID=192944 RepID=UPI001FB3D7AE|nr:MULTISPECIES: 50S ribosomal protein L21 [unclassified Rhodococcus (in: high G+C Gram-positive bacteria)]MCJ0903227.1 50S ribosomal protein L21 [Rhodococcus sp. ARC_M6]MDI9918337.1 50S ribosomal protein L21 [Rhodococcus sp. IEGM 1379]
MATYAIVKTGGKQYKVAVGDLVKVEKIEGEPGTAVSLAPVLVVDGSDLTVEAAKLANVSVTSEIVEHTKGPKIRIHKFKNKTGYHKRQGHRQPLTVIKITSIK